MARAPRLLLLAGVLAIVAAQRIEFSDNRACEINGAPGTCKGLRDCPANLAHYNAKRIKALRSALTACGFNKPSRSSLLCCPGAPSRRLKRPRSRFRNHRLCGTSTFHPGRIVGGERVQSLTDFPWMTALKWPPGGKAQYRCGGAVISERWVLTAGHCVVDDGPVFVRVRDLDLNTTIDDRLRAPPVDVRVERIFRHPEYKRTVRSGLFSDVALLKLEKELVFSDISRPICLPERQRSTAEYERLRRSYIAGWGLTEFGGMTSSHMMWAQVNVTRHSTCQANYERIRVASVADEEHLCANGNDLKMPECDRDARDGSCRGGVDACEGDSGGPLMMQLESGNRQRWETVGIVSFGSGCGHADRPGIYARVDHFIGWIAQIVNGN